LEADSKTEITKLNLKRW